MKASFSVDERSARLVRLCNIWGDVKYLHPWVVSGAVDWDAALEAALPKALAATTDDDEVAAVRVLLDGLHDPATYVERDTLGPGASQRSTTTRMIDGVLVATIAASSWAEAEATARRLSSDLSTARLAVLDLRAPSANVGWTARLVVNDLAPSLVAHDGAGLTRWGVEHRGYRPQSGMPVGGYETLFTISPPELYFAAKKQHPAHVVVVANEASGVPEVAWAMRRTGDATIVVQGHLAHDEFASPRVVPLGGPWSAHLRQGALIDAEPQPDVTLDAALSGAEVIDAALSAAHHPASPRRLRSPPPFTQPSWHPDAAYPDQAFPSRERRLLALFRFWNVIERFYPYLPLMGDGWDRALVDFLPRFESAADVHEYALDVAELAARIPDGHVRVSGSPEVDKAVGSAKAPFDVQVLDGQVVVISLSEKSPPPGIAVGDVIVAVGGEPIEAAMKRARRYLAGSNESFLAYRAARGALAGELGEKLTVTVHDAAGVTHDVSMTRTKEVGPRRTGPVYRLLDVDTGYADLDRLEVVDVGAMFEAFQKTRAIVFDMRGYPRGTASAIAQRLNVRHADVAAQFFDPFVTFGQHETTPRHFFAQALPHSDEPLYRGKTVMLIDERTVSQAEHMGLFLEAANGTTFIGSQTAGADGDVTRLVLPAAISVSFTGRDVRHADGRQLQRIGLVADVRARPTIEGVRAGRDEVLERALAYLRSGK